MTNLKQHASNACNTYQHMRCFYMVLFQEMILYSHVHLMISRIPLRAKQHPRHTKSNKHSRVTILPTMQLENK